MLYARIMALRASAALIYDTGLIRRMQPAEITDKIKPITQMLEQALLDAPKNIPEAHRAILQFEAVAMAERKAARDLLDKAEEEERYAKKIRDSIAIHMKALGVKEIIAHGIIVTLSDDGGANERVELR